MKSQKAILAALISLAVISQALSVGWTQLSSPTRYPQPKREVLVDPAASPMYGKIYRTVQGGINYCNSQTPSASKRFDVRVKPGIYSEQVSCSEYVDVTGEGYVEIAREAKSGFVVSIPANCHLRNITARLTWSGAPGSESGRAYYCAGGENVYLTACRGIVDAGGIDGIYCSAPIGGEIRDCLFDSAFDAANLSATASGLTVWNTRFIGRRIITGAYLACGLTSGGGGDMDFYGCSFSVDIGAEDDTPAKAIRMATNAVAGHLRFHNCTITASGGGTNDVDGVDADTSAGATDYIELYDCNIAVSSTSTGTVSGLACNGALANIKMVGGSITKTSAGGTAYDAVCSAGALTLENVASGGAFSGTITQAGDVQAATFDGVDVSALGSGAVLDTDYNAHTILAATADDTPAALEVTEQTLVGRITSGNIAALSVAQIKTLIGDADDDGTTKGFSTFADADFDATSGVVSLVSNVVREADVDDTPVDSATTDPISSNWASHHRYRVVNFVMDGGGYEIPDGVHGDIMIDHACTITSWTLLADVSGAIKVDVWMDTYANFPPTDADTITNAHEPEITASGVKAQDLAPGTTGWSDLTMPAGSILRINVDSCTTITRCTLVLTLSED